ncbi:hypothetical protein [Ligilactobacillus saerimneri]|uniref:hypothetical protein n=1 Tax=Ligilactobacillus saerimneri TaxID=228229 RepID=UPI0024B974FE|nr:hypothetical protein [Ligilactobacillus saerimneri]
MEKNKNVTIGLLLSYLLELDEEYEVKEALETLLEALGKHLSYEDMQEVVVTLLSAGLSKAFEEGHGEEALEILKENFLNGK